MNRRDALKWFTAIPAMFVGAPQPANQQVVLEIDGRKVAEAIIPSIPECVLEVYEHRNAWPK